MEWSNKRSFGREEVSNDLANDKSAWKLFIKTRLIHVCVENRCWTRYYVDNHDDGRQVDFA